MGVIRNNKKATELRWNCPNFSNTNGKLAVLYGIDYYLQEEHTDRNLFHTNSHYRV